MTGDRYMMATAAEHQLGDLSRDEPALAIVYPDRETEQHYVGQWATGYGFIGVRFPKGTTRPLTEAEHAQYAGRLLEAGAGFQLVELGTWEEYQQAHYGEVQHG